MSLLRLVLRAATVTAEAKVRRAYSGAQAAHASPLRDGVETASWRLFSAAITRWSNQMAAGMDPQHQETKYPGAPEKKKKFFSPPFSVGSEARRERCAGGGERSIGLDFMRLAALPETAALQDHPA